MSLKIFAGKVCECGKNYETVITCGLPVVACFDESHGDIAIVDSNIIFSKMLGWLPFDGLMIPYKGFVNGLKAWWCWFSHHGTWFDSDDFDDFD